MKVASDVVDLSWRRSAAGRLLRSHHLGAGGTGGWATAPPSSAGTTPPGCHPPTPRRWSLIHRPGRCRWPNRRSPTCGSRRNGAGCGWCGLSRRGPRRPEARRLQPASGSTTSTADRPRLVLATVIMDSSCGCPWRAGLRSHAGREWRPGEFYRVERRAADPHPIELVRIGPGRQEA
jgi:hypothetical protein